MLFYVFCCWGFVCFFQILKPVFTSATRIVFLILVKPVKETHEFTEALLLF